MKNILDDDQLGKYDKNDFHFYRNFLNLEDALDYKHLLESNDIPFSFEGIETIIDEAIVGTPIFPKIILKLVPEDFRKVNDLVELEVLKTYPDVESHQLNEMTDHELLNILKHQDEWSIENVIITRKLLSIRGIPIPEEHVEQLKQDRLEILQKGRKEELGNMIGYMAALIITAVVVSPYLLIGGIGMGWYYWKDKTVDMDGNKFFTFEKNTRSFGFIVLIVSALIFFTALGIGILGFIEI